MMPFQGKWRQGAFKEINDLQKNLFDIQMLRAVAAFAVLFFHVEREISRGDPNLFSTFFVSFAWLGQSGVDIFFVISGFIMYHVHQRDFARQRVAPRFLLRRLVRIVPTYWLLTTITVVALIFLPSLFNSRSIDWEWVVASYLFIPWQSPAGDISPPVGPGWTLNYEMYFYLLFAFLLFFPRRTAISAMTCFLSAAVLLGLVLQPVLPIFHMMTSALLIEFLCGVWIAYAFSRGVTLGKWTRIALGGAALVVVAAAPSFYTNGDLATWWRMPFFGLPAAALMAVTILRPGLQAPVRPLGMLSRIFVAMGDSSYALYLTHVFTIRIVDMSLKWLLPSLPAGLGFVLLFFAAVVVGHLFFLLIELPLHQSLKNRVLYSKKAEASE